MVKNIQSFTIRNYILEQRRIYLSEKPTIFRGQSLARISYLKLLETNQPTLSFFQKSCLVGVILSDGSTQFSKTSNTARITIQQSVDHGSWLLWIRDKVFKEYIPRDGPLSHPSKKRLHMFDCQTFTCSTFYNEVVPLFYPTVPREKGVTASIEDWINPVSVATWFCGDGGSQDRKKKPDKTLKLHTENFTEAHLQILVDALGRKLGLKARVAPRGYIEISGKSYDTFVEVVGPYIHPDFFYRVPAGRADGSQHGFMTKELREKWLGSKLDDIDSLIHDYVDK